MSYFDEYNFLHDEANKISGNPMIYSAYWRELSGEYISYSDIYYRDIFHSTGINCDLKITRHPLNDSPTSLDEIIGGTYLELIDSELLDLYDWRWHDTLHSPSKFRIFQALVYCAFKDRNFFKDNNVRDLHPIAYWCPWHIQYYSKKKDGKLSIHLAPFFYLWMISVLVKKNYKKGEKQTGSISQRNISWLILRDLKSKYWIRLIDHVKNFNEYFKDESHPIRVLVNKEKV